MLFSHAMQSMRLQSYFLCARLASEGFVVVAPDHPGTTFSDFAPARLQPALTDQPLDLAFLLDAPLFKEPLAEAPPTLMVSGTRDDVTPPPNQDANYRDAGAPKMLARFAGGSHLAPASNWCTIANTPECHPPYLTGDDPYEALDELTVDFLRLALDGDPDAPARLADTSRRFAAFLRVESDGV